MWSILAFAFIGFLFATPAVLIQIDVETPTRLTARQKELLCEFRETETGEECPQSRGFFDKVKEFWDDLTE